MLSLSYADSRVTDQWKGGEGPLIEEMLTISPAFVFLFCLLFGVTGLVPRLDTAGLTINIFVAELYGPHCTVMAAGAFCEAAVEDDEPVLVRTEQLLEAALVLSSI